MWVEESALAYLPIFLMGSIGLIVGLVLIGINYFAGAKNTFKNTKKFETYECGVDPVGNARQQFSVRYYVVGIVFLLFDVEVLFLYPWSIIYKSMIAQGPMILIEMISFMAVLLVGYVYLISKKGLDWD